MPKLTLLMGLPASGKSTWRAKHVTIEAVVSTDDYIESWASAKGLTYSEGFSDLIGPATEHMQQVFTYALKSKRDIIVDQTCLTAKKRRSYINIARQRGYEIVIYVFMPPNNVSAEHEHQHRLANRPGKNIPNHVIESMLKTFQMPTAEEADHIYYIDTWGNK